MTDNISDIRINSQRLWDSIMEMAKIGATKNNGSHRLALSDEDKIGRDLFKQWAEEAGCTVTVDAIGNMFARRAGKDEAKAPVGSGSHLDTQPYGGRFDGVFGVLAALEVVRTLNDHNIETETPIEIVNWTNEEGARFAPPMLASGVFGGHFEYEYAMERVGVDGKTFGEELERIGYRGSAPVGNHPFTAFFECHIEQGPILEQKGVGVGIVTDVQGFRWYDISFEGVAQHTGSTPMVGRRNALLGVAQVITAVDKMADDHAPHARCTVGSQFNVEPGSRNIIPGRVDFTVDIRHPSAETLLVLDEKLKAACQEACDSIGLEMTFEENSYSPPVEFDTDCVAAIKSAAEAMDIPAMEIISGAGHDACYVNIVSPTAMIFSPCKDGISHNEAEYAKQEDLADCANVLLHAMLQFANAN